MYRHIFLFFYSAYVNRRGASANPNPKYQYCIKKDVCTELDGRLSGTPANISNTFPGATESQLAMLQLLSTAAEITSISTPDWYSVSQSVSQVGLVMALPSDQWIRELQNWEAIVWSSHQVTFVDHAIGPAMRETLAGSIVLPAREGPEKDLCQKQKMRKPGGFV